MYQYVSYTYLQNITWHDMTLRMNVAGCSNQPSHFNASKAIRLYTQHISWSANITFRCMEHVMLSDHNQKENMCYLYLDDFRKNKTMSHLAMNSPGFTSVFTPKEGVMPGKLRHRDSATKWWIHSFEINKTALIRLEDWFQIHTNLSFFPIWTFCIAARRTFEKTVRHRHVMTYHTSWSSDSSICQISYGSWLNLHWSSYILILGEYAATPPTIKYG